MSNEDGVKVQTAPDPVAGAQKPLAGDSKKSTHGFDSGFQDTMSICRGPNVEAGSAPVAGGARNDLNRGATVTGRQQERAKPVDAKCIEGSYPGDTRKSGDTAAASLQRAANGVGGVRGPAGQFPNGKRDATLGSFSNDSANQTFPGNQGDSEAGN
jgi:hypothetical protein